MTAVIPFFSKAFIVIPTDNEFLSFLLPGLVFFVNPFAFLSAGFGAPGSLAAGWLVLLAYVDWAALVALPLSGLSALSAALSLSGPLSLALPASGVFSVALAAIHSDMDSTATHADTDPSATHSDHDSSVIVSAPDSAVIVSDPDSSAIVSKLDSTAIHSDPDSAAPAGRGLVIGVLPASGGYRVYRARAGADPFARIMAQWRRDGGCHGQQQC